MAKQRPRHHHPFRIKAITIAVASCFSVSAGVHTALANPTGGAVVSGSASFNRLGNTLKGISKNCLISRHIVNVKWVCTL